MKRKDLASFLPKALRLAILRRSLRIPSIAGEPYGFQIATTKMEMEAAYALVHDSYVRSGLMDPASSGLRCSLYNAIPYTTLIVAKYGEKVVGTISLIRDSSFGLPCDAQYKNENDEIRKRGFRLVEVSGLAVHEDFRKKRHVVTMNMIKYIYQYAERHMKCDGFVIAVRSKTEDFYSAFLGYERTGAINACRYVKGVSAVHMFNSLRMGDRDRYRRRYPSLTPDRNLVSYTQSEPSEHFIFPRRSVFAINPVHTPETLDYFFRDRTTVMDQLSERQRGEIFSAYPARSCSGSFETAQSPARQFRCPLVAVAVINVAGSAFVGKVLDISEGGLFLATENELEIGQIGQISVQLDRSRLVGEFVVRWRNQGQAGHLPSGYGVEFSRISGDLKTELRTIHYQSRIDAPMGHGELPMKIYARQERYREDH